MNLLIEYPPPYHRLIWDYSNADILNIRKSISSINWSHLFSDNHIDVQVSIFEECALNVFKNFVPNKYVVFDDKEPVWMDQSIKQLIKERDSCYSKYQSQGRRVEDLHIVTSLTDKINEQISNNRKSYFLNLSNQLNDKCLNPKKYWTLLRSFYNGRKVPLIPPILKGNKYVSDFKEKANYFNEFFSLQCSPVVNSSVLPDKSYLTASSLESITISGSDILKTIRSLDINKAHGHDDISVRMMKICDDAIVEPLKMLFVNSVNQAVFPSRWKKANVIPVHKKTKNIL